MRRVDKTLLNLPSSFVVTSNNLEKHIEPDHAEGACPYGEHAKNSATSPSIVSV